MITAPHILQAEPLSAYQLFRTQDVETARMIVAEKFCSHELAPQGDGKTFDVCHNHAAGQSLSLNYLHYGCDVAINPGELTDFYLIQIPIRGGAAVRNGCKDVEAQDRVGTVLNPTRETRMIWYEGCEKLLLQIDRGALEACAERLLGRPLPCAIVFDPELQLTDTALQGWEKKFRAALCVAEQMGAFGTKMHKHQALYEEELITGFLMAQPNTIDHILRQPAPQISSTQVSRARSYVLENLSEPITVAQIASAAGCSIRSLQLAFQRTFDCSPVTFLQRERLNNAHLLLQSLPAETRVSDIAYSSGFSHLGRFSLAYRRTFGASPRETLTQRRFS